MQTKLLDGSALAAEIRRALAEAVKNEGLSPGLGAVLVGDDPASRLYVSMKEKAGHEIGLRFEITTLPETASQQELLAAIEASAARTDIHGILLQLPLPDGFDTAAAIKAIPDSKDADGLKPGSPVISPLLQAVRSLVQASGVDPKGRTASAAANSPVFQAKLLESLVKMGFSEAEEPADVAVVALGKPASFGRARVNAGGVVIDVGTTRVGEKVLGDADAASLDGYLMARSPVPGGVGPLVVACLLKNVVELCRRSKASGTA